MPEEPEDGYDVVQPSIAPSRACVGCRHFVSIDQWDRAAVADGYAGARANGCIGHCELLAEQDPDMSYVHDTHPRFHCPERQPHDVQVRWVRFVGALEAWVS